MTNFTIFLKFFAGISCIGIITLHENSFVIGATNPSNEQAQLLASVSQLSNRNVRLLRGQSNILSPKSDSRTTIDASPLVIKSRRGQRILQSKDKEKEETSVTDKPTEEISNTDETSVAAKPSEDVSNTETQKDDDPKKDSDSNKKSLRLAKFVIELFETTTASTESDSTTAETSFLEDLKVAVTKYLVDALQLDDNDVLELTVKATKKAGKGDTQDEEASNNVLYEFEGSVQLSEDSSLASMKPSMQQSVLWRRQDDALSDANFETKVNQLMNSDNVSNTEANDESTVTNTTDTTTNTTGSSSNQTNGTAENDNEESVASTPVVNSLFTLVDVNVSSSLFDMTTTSDGFTENSSTDENNNDNSMTGSGQQGMEQTTDDENPVNYTSGVVQEKASLINKLSNSTFIALIVFASVIAALLFCCCCRIRINERFRKVDPTSSGNNGEPVIYPTPTKEQEQNKFWASMLHCSHSPHQSQFRKQMKLKNHHHRANNNNNNHHHSKTLQKNYDSEQQHVVSKLKCSKKKKHRQEQEDYIHGCLPDVDVTFISVDSTTANGNTQTGMNNMKSLIL